MKKVLITILLNIVFLNSIILSQNFWQQTGGPSGADLYQIKVDSFNVLYVVERPQDNSKIYRSFDGGQNWEYFTNGSDITFDKNGFFY